MSSLIPAFKATPVWHGSPMGKNWLPLRGLGSVQDREGVGRGRKASLEVDATRSALNASQEAHLHTVRHHSNTERKVTLGQDTLCVSHT